MMVGGRSFGRLLSDEGGTLQPGFMFSSMSIKVAFQVLLSSEDTKKMVIYELGSLSSPDPKSTDILIFGYAY
jgi:hypothetical protein